VVNDNHSPRESMVAIALRTAPIVPITVRTAAVSVEHAMKTLPTLLLPTLCASLAGQAVVSPSHFQNAAGNSNGYAGVGHYASVSRHLQVHDDLAGTPRTIHRIAFRRETPSNNTTVPASSLVCDLRLSTAVTTAAAPNATFAQNHGANMQQVSSFQFCQLPASPPAGAAMPFEYVIPFGQPFQYDGLGPLAWEILVHSSATGGGVLLDACVTGSTNPKAALAVRGVGCKASGKSLGVTLGGDSSPVWSSNRLNLSYLGGNLPNSAPAWIAIGTSGSQWSGVPLPVPVPGSAAAPSGTCSVYNNWLILLPAIASATGSLQTNIGMNVHPGMHGASLFAQAIAIDLAANSVGLVLSNLVEHQVVAPFPAPPVGQVTVASSHNAVGTATARRGAIVRFD
jgi:hypothetical protein